MEDQDNHIKENSFLTDIKILFWSVFPTYKMEKKKFTYYIPQVTWLLQSLKQKP